MYRLQSPRSLGARASGIALRIVGPLLAALVVLSPARDAWAQQNPGGQDDPAPRRPASRTIARDEPVVRADETGAAGFLSTMPMQIGPSRGQQQQVWLSWLSGRS